MSRGKRNYVLLAGLCLFVPAVTFISSCRSPYEPPASSRGESSSRQVIQGPLVSTIRGEPRIRVRIACDQLRTTVGSGGVLLIGPPTGTAYHHRDARRFEAPVTITLEGPVNVENGRPADGFILIDGHGLAVRWALDELQVQSPDRRDLAIGSNAFPGKLIFVAGGSTSSIRPGRFDVINHVPLESYLPGVLERELYASWHPTSYQTQAIVARSYALFERGLHESRHYDIESTEASQVYGGASTRRVARDAVHETRGRVLVYGERVLPAYYSSCSGGLGQDAAAVFPGVVDILPLQGDPHQHWGRTSTSYRWGQMTRELFTLERRFAAWGRENKHPIATISGITAIAITGRNRSGRPTVFSVTDQAGRTFPLNAEWFRFACNYNDPTVPAVPRDKKLKSSFVQVRVVGDLVQFYNGRGLGHGVGLCQWGMEEMARSGYSAESILNYYYRGATVRRIY